MSRDDDSIRKSEIEAALKRLEILLRSQPGSVVRVHSNLNRKRGIKLLDALFDLDEDQMPHTFS